jgi:hypothetical protein
VTAHRTESRKKYFIRVICCCLLAQDIRFYILLSLFELMRVWVKVRVRVRVRVRVSV